MNEEKLVVVTTDNARNIVNATALLHWKHTLQWGVKEGHGVDSDLIVTWGCGRNLVISQEEKDSIIALIEEETER